jgi:ABC-2 type transport system permease protein
MLTNSQHRELPNLGERTARRYRVELRKLLDTASAKAILTITLVAAPAGIPLALLLDPTGRPGAREMAATGLGLAAYILPLLAILSITGEWRLHTVLTTYTLDSARTAVLVAKVAALTTVVVGSVVIANVAGVVTASLLGLPVESPAAVLSGAAGMLVGMTGIALVGVGFGSSLLNTPLAIVLYLTLPPAVPQLLAQIPAMTSVVPYLDIHTPLITQIQTATTPNPAGSTIAALLWIVAPITIGFIRNAHSDIG